MSYTAQLFESLLRASAEGSGSGSGSGSAAPSSSAGVSAPSSSSSAGVAEVPHELDECYAVINFQRKQIGELRERVASLEEQNASVSLGPAFWLAVLHCPGAQDSFQSSCAFAFVALFSSCS